MHCTTNLCLTVKVHKLSTEQKKNKTQTEKRKKQSARGSQINQQKISKFFWNFLISKKGSFGQISKQNMDKNTWQKHEGVFCRTHS
jgi:hypothetical protein